MGEKSKFSPGEDVAGYAQDVRERWQNGSRSAAEVVWRSGSVIKQGDRLLVDGKPVEDDGMLDQCGIGYYPPEADADKRDV